MVWLFYCRHRHLYLYKESLAHPASFPEVCVSAIIIQSLRSVTHAGSWAVVDLLSLPGGARCSRGGRGLQPGALPGFLGVHFHPHMIPWLLGLPQGRAAGACDTKRPLLQQDDRHISIARRGLTSSNWLRPVKASLFPWKWPSLPLPGTQCLGLYQWLQKIRLSGLKFLLRTLYSWSKQVLQKRGKGLYSNAKRRLQKCVWEVHWALEIMHQFQNT